MTADHDADMAGQTGWQILAPLIDLVTPMAVRVAATLRLADPMRDGPVGIDELARRVGADPDALARLMRHLVAHGMFSQPQPGVFGANATAALLDSAHPSGMQVSLDLSGFGGRWTSCSPNSYIPSSPVNPPGNASTVPRTGNTSRPIL